MPLPSIHGCTPADTLISRLVIPKSICGLYTSCVSTACFKMKYVRQAHVRKCHSFQRVAPINHKRTTYVLLSKGGRVGEKKGTDTKQARPKNDQEVSSSSRCAGLGQNYHFNGK